jgi:hypothetical protein
LISPLLGTVDETVLIVDVAFTLASAFVVPTLRGGEADTIAVNPLI